MEPQKTCYSRRSFFKNQLFYRAGFFLRFCLFITLFLSSFTGITAGDESPSNQTGPEPIPVAEIATQAIKVPDFIRELRSQFSTSQQFNNILKDISDVTTRMAVAEQETMKTLQAQPPLERLQAEGIFWQKNKAEMDKNLDFLSNRADKLQSALSQLGDLQKKWSQTLDFATSIQVEDKLIQQVNEVIGSIETEQKSFQSRQAAIIDLQRKVAERVAQCETILDQISQFQRTAISAISGLERHPIWSKNLWERSGSVGFVRLYEIAAYPKADLKLYFFGSNGLIWIHLGFFVFLSVLFIIMRNMIKQWTPDESSSLISYVFERPYAASLIVTLLTAAGPIFSTPATVKNLFMVLALMAMIRLMKPAIDQTFIFVLYALGLLFALDMVRHAFTGLIFFNQMMIVAEALVGLGVLGWLLKRRILQPSFTQAMGLTRLNVFRAGAIFIMVFLAAGLVAGVLGYLLAAHFFVSSVIVGGALAMEIFVFIKIFSGIAAFCLRVWPLRHLNMVSRHRNFLERRFYRILIWMAVVTWVVRVLDYVGLYQPVLLFFNSLLSAKLERGTISISLEDVFAFIFSVLTAYILSRFICFILNEDVYPRTKVPHGISYAMTRLLHYLIIVIGFVVGVGLLGMDLTKVTVLISAFGVGIGFGLQSVVNNFVSGLILLFERPIHAEDIVEVGSIQGIVRRIGIRASILQTRQGAEIIIPNSQLVSDQVTNWTYSDQRRRIDLPFGVNYSAKPQNVIEVLSNVALAHPMVLKNPPPQVLLTGFGDSSINYELRAWTDDFENWPNIKSDLAVLVYDAIHASGMSFPFPQREIRLIKDKDALGTMT